MHTVGTTIGPSGVNSEDKQTNRVPEPEVKRKTINDPEQLATRISGLRMDTEYDVAIWPRTKAGRGEKAQLRIRTAQLTQSKPYFRACLRLFSVTEKSGSACIDGELPVDRTIYFFTN